MPRNGHELVLVARREDRLNALADEIAKAGRPRPVVLTSDLEQRDAAGKIAAELTSRGLEPQFVVNNAGFGLTGEAAKLDRNEQLAMIDLNVRTLTELSLTFVDSLARHRGGLLNVASVAAFLPGPGMAVYYATKAYVLSFTEALHQEWAGRGIRVSALCPGPVPTEFQARASMELPGAAVDHRIAGRPRGADRLRRPDARPAGRDRGARQQACGVVHAFHAACAAAADHRSAQRRDADARARPQC